LCNDVVRVETAVVVSCRLNTHYPSPKDINDLTLHIYAHLMVINELRTSVVLRCSVVRKGIILEIRYILTAVLGDSLTHVLLTISYSKKSDSKDAPCRESASMYLPRTNIFLFFGSRHILWQERAPGPPCLFIPD
jgi:hypothetical protein